MSGLSEMKVKSLRLTKELVQGIRIRVCKQVLPPGERQWDDEEHEQAHLGHEEEENQAVVERHGEVLSCRRRIGS